MKKYIVLTIISLLLGYLMAKVIFIEYKNDSVIALSKPGEKYYFLQMGVYSSYESMVDNSSKLSKYIYTMDNGKYYVFTCISKKLENISKMEKYFNDSGYETYIKEFNLLDDELSETINYVDTLDDDIKKMCDLSISKYKEG